MECIDYGRSFLAGKAPWNSVRFWIESRTRVVDERSGAVEDYYQCGSCKSEDTFAEKNLFYDDNYDFLPVFGPRWGVVFRRRAHLNENYRSCVEVEKLWDGQDYHVVVSKGARTLQTNAEIREACAAWLPLVSRTEIEAKDAGLRVIVECPVKTINIHSEKDLYQVDTGPVALPDLAERHEPVVAGFSLAFIAFNRPDTAYLVIEAPTPIEGGKAAMVYHYSKLVDLPARNTLLAVPV